MAWPFSNPEVEHRMIDFENRDGIAFITLNAPPRNEMDNDFFREFARISRRLPELDLGGVVVRGVSRHFSSGAALEEIITAVRKAEGSEAQEMLHEHSVSFQVLRHLTCPTVAVINGCCLGSALELALSCRFRIASETAVFALPEVQYGLMPGCGGTILLRETVGVAQSVSMILSGRMVDADEAVGMGLIDMIAGRDTQLDMAYRIIEKCNCRAFAG
jgi:enoyl-CoA hydratase/carnithine racemase